MSAIALIGGRVIDPANKFDGIADVLISDGKIKAIGKDVLKNSHGDFEKIDVSGRIVCPGLIDIHVHLREPGQSAKETIATGTEAAARGGFTSVLCMPNTSPAIDNPANVALIEEKAAKQGKVNVFIAGAITKNIAGEELSPIGSLKQAGVVAITDDGHCVQNNELMRRALEYSRMFNLPVLDHCQDYSLVTDGVMHEGYWSVTLGLRGWPAAGEEMMVLRDVLLSELTGAHVHCQHISSAKSVEIIREAKKRGVRITAEACPHHFTLTDNSIAGSDEFWKGDGRALLESGAGFSDDVFWHPYDTNFKVNPPLRSAADRDAIIEGIVDGTIDVIASDHAPHCLYEKEVEFDFAPFGMTGLETSLSLSLMRLYHNKKMDLADLIARMTIKPARILGIDRGTLSVGAVADVTVIDPNLEWRFNLEHSASKSKNSPFGGWKLKGRAVLTIAGGNIVWKI